MLRRWLIGSVCGSAGLALIGIAIVFLPPALSEPKLNVLLITLDTTRADHIGCYGRQSALTPTLDDLARRGILFERAYTPMPLTLPAHASIHTGLYSYKHGVFTNGH